MPFSHPNSLKVQYIYSLVKCSNALHHDKLTMQRLSYRWIVFIILISSSSSSSKLHTKNEEIAGLILARKGSKGITGKNMVDLHGRPLIAWSLEAMISSNGIFTTLP